METFQIAELARRTGFSRPTLRYYEEIGLLDEPERSESGYRVYDRDDEARLQFIHRAKRLGLSLDEIRDLVRVWAGGECAATRRQLRELVEHKITAVREQVEEWATFLRQLEVVSDRLAEEPEVSDSCGCAPELPHVNAVQRQRDLSLVNADECTCGGSCGGMCSCGCACCERSVELSEDPDRTIEERRDHREDQHTCGTTTTEVQCGCGCGTTDAEEETPTHDPRDGVRLWLRGRRRAGPRLGLRLLRLDPEASGRHDRRRGRFIGPGAGIGSAVTGSA